LRDPKRRQLFHRAGRRLSGRHRARRDGQIRAFHNSCRHRGSRVCWSTRASAAKLVCPYHQWTYDLDGSLLFARQMGEDFDKSEVRPEARRLRERRRLHLHLPGRPADGFRAVPGDDGALFRPHRLRRRQGRHESTIIEKGNWKLVWENNRECYHCAGNHPELCKTFPEAPTVTGVNGAKDDPEIAEHWEKCEAIGLPSQFVIDEAGQFRATRMPLIARRSATPCRAGKRRADATLRQRCEHGPDRHAAALPLSDDLEPRSRDHAITFRVLPLSATETAVTTKWLVHKDAVEGIDYVSTN
jgi:Rieske 2Fe-2S family protein